MGSRYIDHEYSLALLLDLPMEAALRKLHQAKGQAQSGYTRVKV